ncbi:MAG TPA: PQQ-binding-like beta-propeller repeat protein, partial [Polymorphobacter sp.]|nr:PQQ-binding-like beta-propeller repeat protein [Polymorphobacter sp.]
MRLGNAVSSAALALALLMGPSACDKLKQAGAASSGPASVDEKRLANAESDPANWITHGGSYNEQRFSRLTDVNDSNVGKLSLAWSYDLDTKRGQEATPLVIDGVMYTTTAWSKVVALDAATGKELWTYDPQVPGERGHSACCDVVNRGPAIYGDKVFF